MSNKLYTLLLILIVLGSGIALGIHTFANHQDIFDSRLVKADSEVDLEPVFAGENNRTIYHLHGMVSWLNFLANAKKLDQVPYCSITGTFYLSFPYHRKAVLGYLACDQTVWVHNHQAYALSKIFLPVLHALADREELSSIRFDNLVQAKNWINANKSKVWIYSREKWIFFDLMYQSAANDPIMYGGCARVQGIYNYCPISVLDSLKSRQIQTQILKMQNPTIFYKKK